MGQAQTEHTLQGPASIGIGWRVFQVGGLLIAISWLVSYAVFLDGYEAFVTIFGLSNPLYVVGGIGYALSPLMSLVLVAIAVWPGALAFLNRGDRPAMIARGLILVVPTMWLGAVFLGDSSMINEMLRAPMGHSSALPVFGGAFFHTVFQHWFQGFSAILLALVPGRFATLTNADRPAGTGAIVRDVTAQMELEDRLQALRKATQRMMRADDPAEVAAIGAEAADDVLDVSYSRVHLRDEDTDELVPAAWTDDTERVLEGEPPTVDPDSGPVWDSFRAGESNYYHNYDALDGLGDADPETPLESSLLLPLGDHGIMLVQSTEPSQFSNEKIELAHVLSANTRAALEKTEHERELDLVRALLDHSSEAVFVVDPATGEIRDANDTASLKLDYDSDDLPGRSLADLLSVRAASDEVADGRDGAVDLGDLLAGVRRDGLETRPGELQGANGSTVPVELTLTHVEHGPDAGRGVTGSAVVGSIIAIARDVSDVRDLREDLATRREELDCLGLLQTLVDQIVREVLGEQTRGELELQACEVLADSPYYDDAWLVDPERHADGVATVEGTADGGKLRSVGDMAPGTPATEAIQDTIETDATNVVVPDAGSHDAGSHDAGSLDAGSLDAGGPEGEGHEAGPTAADDAVVALPLTYGEANYGALVVVADRAEGFGTRERAALETLALALAFAIHVRETEAATRSDTVELAFEASNAGPASTAVLTRLAAALGSPVRLDGLVPGSDGGVLHYYVTETDRAAEAVRDRVSAVEGVEDCRIIEHDGAGECRFELRVRDAEPADARDPLEAIVEAGAVVRTAEAGPDDARLVVDVLPEVEPGEIERVLQAADATWTRTDTRRVEGPMGRLGEACAALEDSLTDRQREALLTAYFGGYYDHPRSSTAQDVANTLAISDSTLFQHLQAAQRKLIEAWMEPTGDAPAAPDR